MRRDDRIRLEHMRDAAREALGFAEGRSEEDLNTDRKLLYAIVMAVAIIGEAAARMTQESRDTLDDVPWKAVIGMRNRLVHAYFDIDPQIVWRTVSDELPPLLAALDSHLGQSPD